MFFEDVDLGWRLNLLGWRFRYEPESLAYHRHHASMSEFGSLTETYLLERNALFTLYKNLDEESPRTMRCPRRWRSRCVAPSRAASLDSDAFDLRSAGADDGARRQDDLASTALASRLRDRPVRRAPAVPRRGRGPRSRRPDGRRDARSGRCSAGRCARSSRDRSTSTGYEKIVNAFTVRSRPAPTQGPHHHGRPDRREDGRPRHPRVEHRRACSSRARGHAAHAVGAASTSGAVRARARALRRRPLVRAARGTGPTSSSSRATRWPCSTGAAESTKILVVDIYDPMHLEQLEQGKRAAGRPAGQAGERRDRGAQRAAAARRLLPVRIRAAARCSGSASSPPSAASTR